MSNKFNISVTDIGFSIMKTTKHVIIGWLYFAIHTLVIYSFVFVMYYFLRKNIRVEYFVLFSVLFFVVFYFINKKHLKTRTVKIDKTVNGYRFEDGAIYAMDVKKTFVLYEYTGETLLKAIGNLHLKIGKSEYPIYYSATEDEMNEIKNKLEAFFSEHFIIEKKALY